MTLLSALMDRYRLVITGAFNVGLVVVSYLLAFALRFDFDLSRDTLLMFERTLPLLLAVKLVSYSAFGLYHGWWRYVTLQDLIDIVKANVAGSAAFVLIVVFTRGLEGFPRSVFLMEAMLAVSVTGGARGLIRSYRERCEERGPRRITKLALVVGASPSGIQLVRELNSNRRLGTAVVGFVDDIPSKTGTTISGVKVLGPIDDIPQLALAHDIDEVLVAISSAHPKELRRIIQKCNAAHVEYRVLPSLGEIAAGKVMYQQMREVKVEDLLARDPVRLEVARLRSFLEPRTALVTGAAGSIGSELCRQLATYGCRAIVLYERNENGLFALDQEFRRRFPDADVHPVLGDILAADQVARTITRYRPDLVLHAAACKHVPISELNVVEAARNNVLGTRTLVHAARDFGVREFVMVSTDKAVRPTSVMGATKRVAEVVVRAQQDGGCKFVSVRFGNVLGSAGSVVPIFAEQIARGGPVTITHPEMQRFFMTIPEAAQLILQAATMGRGGEIFVLEMGEPVRIVDLARNMIKLSGFQPDEDIPIVYSGLRPGEKLSEELFNPDEEIEATFFDRIKILKSAARAHAPIDELLDALEMSVASGDEGGVISVLQTLAPDYTPSEHVLPRVFSPVAAVGM